MALTLVPAMSAASRLRISRPLDRALSEALPDIQAILYAWRWRWGFTHGELAPVEIDCPVGEDVAIPNDRVEAGLLRRWR